MLDYRPTSVSLAALLAVAVLAPGAVANVPKPVTKSNTVRIPALGNLADGTLTTKVTYTVAAATAAASTGSTIGLGPGWLFRLRTCVAYHRHGSSPVSSCAERMVDTRSNGATVYTYAPSVTLSAQPRPTTQPWGYFKPYVEVMHESGGSWPVDAHSWPDGGLQGAGIGVAAQGASAGALPGNSTVTFETPFTSAINSGWPDSICTAQVGASNGSPLPAGVSTSHPAFAGAPAYYEVGLPTGAYAGQPPRGVMLVIHGGGWTFTSVGGVQAMRPDADRWRARGWQTVNLTYRSCGQSVADVLWFHDKARAGFGAAARICAMGTSAGGHLALQTAAKRAGVYCAVSVAGPTDLRTIQSEVAYDSLSGQFTQTVGGRWVHNLAAAAVGEENLAAFSPAAQPSPTLKSTRVLQAFSADDAMVPYQQAADLADAMRAADPAAYVDSLQLATGTIAFGHGTATQAALDDFYARETQLVAP
jgi:acetyl esterase/lipase